MGRLFISTVHVKPILYSSQRNGTLFSRDWEWPFDSTLLKDLSNITEAVDKHISDFWSRPPILENQKDTH